MKIISTYFAASAAVSLLCSVSLQAQAVAKPAARQSILKSVDDLLDAKPQGLPPGSVDPFNSDAFQETMGFAKRAPVATGPVTVGPRSDREILESIAANLRPSGNFILGGQQTLIFGQKRVKAGGSLPINFEGVEYTIEITAIDRANYTLKLNTVELTRPIK